MVVTKISKYLTEDRDRIPNQLHQQFFFMQLKKYVTSYAIFKILPQVKKFKEKQKKGKDLDPYIGAFTKIWGLPYAHIIEKRWLEDIAIPLIDIDQHWQFYKLWLIQNNSPDTQWEDWPKDWPQRRHFYYISSEKTLSLEPMLLPKEVENQRFTSIDSIDTISLLEVDLNHNLEEISF